MSNRLDPDQARHFVRPDLGPNCLQKLSADDTRRELKCIPAIHVEHSLDDHVIHAKILFMEEHTLLLDLG